MTRDDVQRELAQVRRRRLEARRLDADLQHEQAALEGMLGRELDGDTSDDLLAGDEYGALRSAADLPAAIHGWREHIPSGTSLWTPVQADRDHARGDPAAPVVVVEYGDYQSIECAEAHELHARVSPWLEDGRLCVVFRHFPLVDAHALAMRAAQAAEAAAAQGRFWEMHDVLMRHGVATDDDRQQHLLLQTPRSEIELDRAAHRAGLDVERFRSDLNDAAALERILDDFRGGLASGANGTPTFYVNGERTDITGVEDLYDKVVGLVAV